MLPWYSRPSAVKPYPTLWINWNSCWCTNLTRAFLHPCFYHATSYTWMFSLPCLCLFKYNPSIKIHLQSDGFHEVLFDYFWKHLKEMFCLLLYCAHISLDTSCSQLFILCIFNLGVLLLLCLKGQNCLTFHPSQCLTQCYIYIYSLNICIKELKPNNNKNTQIVFKMGKWTKIFQRWYINVQ